MPQSLTTTDHSRDIAGLKYVYPVISRRAGGLSIGINFNPNNACNWRCVYCQVPNLKRGSAPVMDFHLLEEELRFFLDLVLHGDFYDQFNVSASQRVIKDIALSGNGEPTSLKNLDKAIDLIGQTAMEMGVFPASDFVLISNGSLMHQQAVQDGLKVFNKYGGQVWFKLDSATEQGRKKINDTNQTNKKTLKNLQISSRLCDTQLQTCLMDYLTPEEVKVEAEAYIEFLKQLKENQIELKKIMLYTIARPSCQPESMQIKKLDGKQMKLFAEKVMQLGYEVQLSI